LEPRGKRKEETRKLHIEELHDLYYSPDIILSFQVKKNETRGACGIYREE